jgi:hypothetical protein
LDFLVDLILGALVDLRIVGADVVDGAVVKGAIEGVLEIEGVLVDDLFEGAFVDLIVGAFVLLGFSIRPPSVSSI